MRNKYEELPMIDETMTEPVTVNNEFNNNNNNNNSNTITNNSNINTSNSNNNDGFSVAIEVSTPSSFTVESEELATEESVAESLSSTLRTKVGSDKDKTDEENEKEAEDDEDLKSKYVKLIEHNSKLVDLLKTTMQIQTDMFRKLIHYVFP